MTEQVKPNKDKEPNSSLFNLVPFATLVALKYPYVIAFVGPVPHS